MFIREYMNEGMYRLSRMLPVTVLTALLEWAAFLYFAKTGPRAGTGRALRTAAAAGAVYLVWSLQLLPISLHCCGSIVIWTVCICLVRKERWHNAVFESSIFCLVLELGKSLCRSATFPWLLSKAFPGLGAGQIAAAALCVYFAYLLAAFALLRARKPDLRALIVTPGQTAALMFPLLLYLGIRQYQASLPGLPGTGKAQAADMQTWLTMEVLQLCVAVCALIVIWVTTGLLAAQAEKQELLLQKMLAEKQHHQYLVQKEAMEAVRHKYHDLKHFLKAAETAGHGEELGEFIRDLRREIEPYETLQETGNRVLNILLAERIRECQRRQIRLIPAIDARGLSFMSTVDLCTLFGNAMDNAVEACEKIEETEKREIRIRIAPSGDMTVMRFQNTFEGPDGLENTALQTTKRDAANHGYGLDSIRKISENYGAVMTIRSDGGIFTLTVLFPKRDVPGEPGQTAENG